MHLLHLLHLIVDLVDESSNFFHLIQPGTPVVSLWHQSPNPCMLAPRHGELDTHPPEKALHEEAISVHRDRNILLRCCPALYGFFKNPIIYYLSKYFFLSVKKTLTAVSSARRSFIPAIGSSPARITLVDQPLGHPVTVRSQRDDVRPPYCGHQQTIGGVKSSKLL